MSRLTSLLLAGFQNRDRPPLPAMASCVSMRLKRIELPATSPVRSGRSHCWTCPNGGLFERVSFVRVIQPHNIVSGNCGPRTQATIDIWLKTAEVEGGPQFRSSTVLCSTRSRFRGRARADPVSPGARFCANHKTLYCFRRLARLDYLEVGDTSRVLFMQLMVQLVDEGLRLLESFSPGCGDFVKSAPPPGKILQL